jgi:hypothetical protein
MSLRSIRGYSCYWLWFAVGVTNGREREKIPSLCELSECIELSCDAPMGRSAPPFIGQGEGAGHTRKREGERESEEEEGPQGRVILHLPYLGPVGPVDDDRNGSTLWPYSSLAPYTGVVSRSWRPILSWRTSWSTVFLDWSRTRIW